MTSNLSIIITDLQLHVIHKEHIAILKVTNPKKGEEIAKKILQTVVDKKTLLLLSGGKTPQALYTEIANDSDQSLQVGTAALIDERYGIPGYENSNEKMLQDSGLLSYFEKNNIPFYGILQHDLSREDAALQYDETLRYLFQNFPKSVAVMGMGVDGHTAGIPANYSRLNLESRFNLNEFVVDYDDRERFYKERITMTFLALSMLDTLIVLVFGKEKKKALQTMFSQGSEEEIPARFYLRSEIAKKTLFITDQKV